MDWCGDEKCKYNDEFDGCLFYVMGSGREEDMPCYRGDAKEGDDEVVQDKER